MVVSPTQHTTRLNQHIFAAVYVAASVAMVWMSWREGYSAPFPMLTLWSGPLSLLSFVVLEYDLYFEAELTGYLMASLLLTGVNMLVWITGVLGIYLVRNRRRIALGFLVVYALSLALHVFNGLLVSLAEM